MSMSVSGRICPYPFSRMESPGTPFIPCCSSWLTEEFLALEAGSDPWNGPAAQALRQSVLDGSYKYCRLDRCGTQLLPKEKLREHFAQPEELPISEANLKGLEAGETVLPEGPSAFTVMGDPRCNLACGSCRTDFIQQATPAVEEASAKTAKLISMYGPNLRILKLAGDGEVFFSPGLREILRGLTSIKLPKLEKVDILTNGLLFDAETLASLRPGSDFIKSVNVSLDAGDEETYKKVRGGDWNRLVGNLRWMASLRKQGRFDFLGLTYVLRAENFRSLPAFLKLAADLGVDEVNVSQLFPWDRMGISFENEAVHQPSHSDHAAFKAMWAEQRALSSSFRWRTNLE
ncbi:MAG: radical SAM protein [Bdellovibrionota bacterium]